MRSLDTTIVARFVLQDDRQQLQKVWQILNDPCWLGVTVVLESWWVITKIGRLSPADAAAAINIVIATRNVTTQQPDAVKWAAAKAAEGADFADMLHLALSGGADVFTTFDRGIALFADGAPVPVETHQA